MNQQGLLSKGSSPLNYNPEVRAKGNGKRE